MDIKQILQLSTAATLLALPLGAMAASADNPTGPYIGAGIGQFNVKVDDLDDVGGVIEDISDSNDTAFKFFAGYRFLPYLAIEGAYVDLGNPGDDFQTSGSDGDYRLSVSGFSASLLGIVPIGPVELFAKVGQYWYDVDTRISLDGGQVVRSSNSGNDTTWGGGVSVVFFDHLDVRAEYERIMIEHADDSNAFWLSAAWRF